MALQVIQPFLYVAIGIGLAIAFVLHHRKATKQLDTQHASFRAGALATRLGLSLVEGDPTYNFLVPDAHASRSRGTSDRRPTHVQIRMQGLSSGVPLELKYLHRVERDTGVFETTYRTWSECRMVAQARRPFPPFEVTFATPLLGRIARTLPLPLMSSPHAGHSSMFEMATHEPAMAELLESTLREFEMFATTGFHLVGDGQFISFLMHEDKSPLMGSALYHAEPMAKLVSTLARRIGG